MPAAEHPGGLATAAFASRAGARSYKTHDLAAAPHSGWWPRSPAGGRIPIKGTMPAADNRSGLATAAFASRAGRAPTDARLVSGRR